MQWDAIETALSQNTWACAAPLSSAARAQLQPQTPWPQLRLLPVVGSVWWTSGFARLQLHAMETPEHGVEAGIHAGTLLL